MDESKVFDALANDSRRRLLDALHAQDGQTLSALCETLPELTRFGCMKHLQVLEDAGLISTRKSGREKLHYLNPMPIQLAYDRWVSKFARPIAQNLSRLKILMEEADMSAPDHVYAILIRTTAERLWQALTDGSISVQYYYQTRVESTWQVGAPLTYNYADGRPAAEGEVLDYAPPSRLGMTFKPLWYDGDLGTKVKLVYDIEPMGSVCRLSVSIYGLGDNAIQREDMKSGFPVILSGLKTLLETGEPLFEPNPA